MGHKNSDMDAIGAAAGMVCAARVKGRPVHIVVDRQHTMANDLIERLETQSEYKGVFISAEDAMIACDFNTLLIVVDVKPSRLCGERGTARIHQQDRSY